MYTRFIPKDKGLRTYFIDTEQVRIALTSGTKAYYIGSIKIGKVKRVDNFEGKKGGRNKNHSGENMDKESAKLNIVEINGGGFCQSWFIIIIGR